MIIMKTMRMEGIGRSIDFIVIYAEFKWCTTRYIREKFI